MVVRGGQARVRPAGVLWAGRPLNVVSRSAPASTASARAAWAGDTSIAEGSSAGARASRSASLTSGIGKYIIPMPLRNQTMKTRHNATPSQR
jgi:hypothetical protein